MIKKGYLEIEYTDRLTMLVFSKIGWEIERETYAGELLQTFERLLEGKDYSFVQELKDRNRGMIILFLDKRAYFNKTNVDQSQNACPSATDPVTLAGDDCAAAHNSTRFQQLRPLFFTIVFDACHRK